LDAGTFPTDCDTCPACLGEVEWQPAKANDLDNELRAVLDTLADGTLSQVVRTAYGYAILIRVADTIVPETTVDQALPQLMYLLNRRFDGGRRDMQIAQLYYQENLAEFRTPDTIALLSHILPYACTGPNATVRRPDTLRSEDIRRLGTHTSNLDFPPLLRSTFRQYQDSLVTGNAYGPLPTGLGWWYFVPGRTKPGGALLPFRQVAEQILTMVDTAGMLLRRQYDLVARYAFASGVARQSKRQFTRTATQRAAAKYAKTYGKPGGPINRAVMHDMLGTEFAVQDTAIGEWKARLKIEFRL